MLCIILGQAKEMGYAIDLIKPRWIFQKSLSLLISTQLSLQADTVEKGFFLTE